MAGVSRAAGGGAAGRNAASELDPEALVRRSRATRTRRRVRCASLTRGPSRAARFCARQCAGGPAAAVDALLARFAAGERYHQLRAVLRRAQR
jgi:hypothetical protein